MFSRRDWLINLATTGICGLAGCAAVTDSEPLNNVELDNNTGEDIQTLVEVTNAAEDTLFRRSFAIKAGSQEEETEWFEGEPARVSIAVGNAEALTAEWSPRITEVRAGERPEDVGESLCVRGGDLMTGIFVRIASPELLQLEPTCGDPQ